MADETVFRAGFVSFVGRPNVGKSTLTNAIVGEKIAITSSKPQTTRRAIRGIVTRTDGQLVLVDTPGVHRPRTLLGERLNDLVQATLSDVDVIGMCVPANEKIGPGDRFIEAELEKYPGARKIAIITKAETVSRGRLADALVAVSAMREWDEVIPVSAQSGENLGALADLLIGMMPVSPRLYDSEVSTDEELEARVAELIREAVLDGVTDELPHSVAVVVDEMNPREGERPLTDVFASIVLERDSQKAIVIGRGGERLREVGRLARAQIESLIGTKVFLKLHVRVRKDWQRSAKELGRLGF